jgi:hypothetical protein
MSELPREDTYFIMHCNEEQNEALYDEFLYLWDELGSKEEDRKIWVIKDRKEWIDWSKSKKSDFEFIYLFKNVSNEQMRIIANIIASTGICVCTIRKSQMKAEDLAKLT